MEKIDGRNFHSYPGDKEAKSIDANQDDRGMVLHPDLWPKWPILPVKRRLYNADGTFKDLECGLMSEATKFTVLLVNMFMFPKTKEDFSNLKRYFYDNVDDLLEDGWVVD